MKVMTWKAERKYRRLVYSLVVMRVTERERERVRKTGGEGESQKGGWSRRRGGGAEGRVRVVIHLMEKSNTKQIHSSQLDA